MSGEAALAVATTPAARAPGRPPGGGYIPVLDGLRAVSIGLVIVGHALYRDRAALPAPLGDVGEQMGWFGVNVFFVISGYLITLLLLREERRTGSISLRAFYARRVLRIFPAFYTYLAVLGALALLGFVRDIPLHDYVASALYVRNIVGWSSETQHLWSLSLEEQFYLLWPSAMVLLAARRRLGAVAAAVAAFTAYRWCLLATGRTTFGHIYMRTDQRMDTILIGCSLALLAGGPRFERLSRAVLERAWFAVAAALALAVWLARPPLPYLDAYWFTTVAILTALLVHWLLRNAGSPAARPLQAPALLYVGRLSYSLYLWQELFLAAPTPEMAAARRPPLDLVLLVACALASYYGIERPFLRLKERRFEKAGAGGPRAAPAAGGDGLP